jgi:hypothetical protein
MSERLWLLHVIFLYAVTLVGVARLRGFALSPRLRVFAGSAADGILSEPSLSMLEKMKLALTPQFQPMRALLFICGDGALLAALAICAAVREKHWGGVLADLAYQFH